MNKEENAKIPESEKIRYPKIFLPYHVLFETMKYGSVISLLTSPFFFYFKKVPIIHTSKKIV